MMSKRVLVVLGHPSTDSFSGALAGAYVEAAKNAGHDVRLLRLYGIARWVQPGPTAGA